MQQTNKNIFAKLMSMDDAAWERHANPLSIWTRVITGIPVIFVSAWSIKSIGWWSLILITISGFWIWLNPRFFSPPKVTNNWASKVTFGERVWLNRSEHPIPNHHQKWATFLSIVAGVGFLLGVIGAFFHIPLLAIPGGLISWFGKMWFCDRMVWLYEDMRSTSKQYDGWLKSKENDSMKKQYHILNGDALKAQFPKGIPGEIYIMRECLVEGNVQNNDLEDFFISRAQFISNAYEGFSESDYYQKSISEFKKIKKIPTNSVIILWFEDDLFCQINFWFIVNFLNRHNSNYLIYLVRPKTGNEYSFGSMSELDLTIAFRNKIKIELSDVQKISELWELYQINDCEKMLEIAKELDNKYPFLIPVINAHIDRIPKEGNLGRPILSIIGIMDELKTKEFEPIFQEFCKRESIYGFGDLQVKRIIDEIINNRQYKGK